MYNIIAFFLVLTLPVTALGYDPDLTKDELIIDFEDHVTTAEAQEFAQRHGLKNFRLNSAYSAETAVYIADIPEGHADRYETLEGYSYVEDVEENVWVKTQGEPNDPLYQYQWNMKQINVTQAWKTDKGNGVVVAVIDTGVAYGEDEGRGLTTVKDLAGTTEVSGYDFVDDDEFAWDCHGHGTHVAGTIAQTTNNKYGVIGVAPEASIMPLRVLSCQGFGQVADIADSIRFAADNGAQVINMSLGGPAPSKVMDRAIKYAHQKDVTIVAAAGNGGARKPSYPAAYDHVIAVAATQYDQHTTFYSQWGDYVDIAAPGGNTRVDQNGDGRPDGVLQETLASASKKNQKHSFQLYMGTSMASPHVAGAAALIVAEGVSKPDVVEDLLQGTASQVHKDKYPDYDERYGAGFLNAEDAVEDAATNKGSWRLSTFLVLAFGAIFGLRRRDTFFVSNTPTVLLSGLFFASGLFWFPSMFGFGEAVSLPFAELGVHFGFFGQNFLMSSALMPLLAVGFLGGHKYLRFVASGVAFGMAGYLFSEAFYLTSDVFPVHDFFDSLWLALNGGASFILGYLNLRRY